MCVCDYDERKSVKSCYSPLLLPLIPNCATLHVLLLTFSLSLQNSFIFFNRQACCQKRCKNEICLTHWALLQPVRPCLASCYDISCLAMPRLSILQSVAARFPLPILINSNWACHNSKQNMWLHGCYSLFTTASQPAVIFHLPFPSWQSLKVAPQSQYSAIWPASLLIPCIFHSQFLSLQHAGLGTCHGPREAAPKQPSSSDSDQRLQSIQ